MTVTHPAAINGGSTPGAINFGGNKYSIDADGEIDCPADVEDAIAHHLAEHYGMSRGDIYEEDGPPDAVGTLPDAADPTPDDDLESKTYDELMEIARDRDVDGRSQMTKDELIDALRED